MASAPLVGTALGALAVVVLSSADARAQGLSEGTLQGDIVDGETGDDVAGVMVTATSPALLGKLTSVSDAEGRYRIDGLPPGTYTLSFVREGFSAEPISDIQVRAGVTLRFDAVVYKEGAAMYGTGTASSVVKVAATAPVVDVGSTQTGGTINADITRRVPLVAPGGKGGANRSFESAAQAMPQVQNDSYGASVNGATSVENQYVIDGVSVNNTAYGYLGSPLSLEFIEELGVVTGGYMPEYGRSMGGLLNVVTKSGGNEFHGSVFGSAAPGFLEGDRAQAPNVGSAIRVQQELNYVQDLGFELGGPILPDTLWFYVGADLAQTSFKLTRTLYRADGTEIRGTDQEFFAEGTAMQAIAKLTWLANADNRVSFTLFATPATSGGAGRYGIDPALGEPENLTLEGAYDALAHQYRSGAVDAQIKWQSALLDRKLRFDTSLGYHDEQGGRFPSDGSVVGGTEGLAGVPRVSFRRSNPGFHGITDFEELPANAGCDEPGIDAAELCPVTTYQAGGPDFLSLQQFTSVQGRHVTTYMTDLFGLHVVKAGAEVGYGTYDNLRTYSGGRRFRDTTSGSLFTDNRQYGFMVGPDSAHLMEDGLQWKSSQLFVGGFLQDSWTAFDVVTVNLGVRWDNQWLFAGDGSQFLALPNQLSPRAGVIFDPFQAGKSKLFASYARYYEQVPLDISDRSGSSEPQLLSGRPAAVCDPTDIKQATGSCMDDANRIALNGPESPNQKWIVTGGGRTAVDPNLQVPSSDEVMVGGELEVFRDARVAATYTRRWINVAIEDMSRDEANTYFIGNPGYGIATDFDKAVRDYDAVTVLFHKQWSEGWLGQASYTYSMLRGNYAGLFRPETEQLDPNINSDFDLKSLTVNRGGALPFDRNHQFKTFAAREFEAAHDTKFTLGGGASAISGAPTNYLGSHALYGGDEVFILPRGSGERLPWVFSGDVHGGFTITPVKGHALEFTVDVFNVFNFQAATLVDETYTEADVNPLQNCQQGVRDSCTVDDLGKLQYADSTPYDQLDNNQNFGQPLEFQAPRTVRLGLRWSF
ncbi:MAG: hypothetical protein A2138_25695 [Deltaproteobacteria bacterium RBG_16_71_12]|nr:MAG: hypothetical protein A2138_25695 [Deltaproteobacteria bacterium RBG_16_71_12]